MKKWVYVMSLVLPCMLLMSTEDAYAQRKNTTSHDVHRTEAPAYSPASERESLPALMHHAKQKKDHMKKGGFHDKNHQKTNCGCAGAKKCMKHQNKDWVAEKTADIQENYNEAIKKINKSTFNQNQKDLLTKQARENQDLALEQLKEKAELRAKHRTQRQEMNMEDFMKDKVNRKAVKKVMKIK